MSWLVLVLSGVLEAVWAAASGRSSAVTRSVGSGPTQPSASTTTTPTSPGSRRQRSPRALRVHPPRRDRDGAHPAQRDRHAPRGLLGRRHRRGPPDGREVAGTHYAPWGPMGHVQAHDVRGPSGIIVMLAEELKS